MSHVICIQNFRFAIRFDGNDQIVPVQFEIKQFNGKVNQLCVAVTLNEQKTQRSRNRTRGLKTAVPALALCVNEVYQKS